MLGDLRKGMKNNGQKVPLRTFLASQFGSCFSTYLSSSLTLLKLPLLPKRKANNLSLH